MIRYMSFHKNIIQLFIFKKKMSLDLMLFRNFILGKKNSDKEVCKDSAHEYCLEVLFVY